MEFSDVTDGKGRLKHGIFRHHKSVLPGQTLNQFIQTGIVRVEAVNIKGYIFLWWSQISLNYISKVDSSIGRETSDLMNVYGRRQI